MTPEEKKDGVPHILNKSTDFISCMEDCGVSDMGFTGNPYTWCNGRKQRRRIMKRLDRILINEEWVEEYQKSSVEHLAKTGSHHNLLLFRCSNDNDQFIRYFKFLNFWTQQPEYIPLIEETWSMEVRGNSMWIL